MERGLIWLPLLALFIGLAWAGWNEYQKVEAYRYWAQQFDRAKYDLYAVLGQKDDTISWGKPSRGEPKFLETFSLNEVSNIQLFVDGHSISPKEPLPQGRANIHFTLTSGEVVEIPFTETSLAAQWTEKLQELAHHNSPK